MKRGALMNQYQKIKKRRIKIKINIFIIIFNINIYIFFAYIFLTDAPVKMRVAWTIYPFRATHQKNNNTRSLFSRWKMPML